MKIYTLERQSLAPVPLERAFAVFEDPYNLARITPPWLNFRVTSRERVAMRPGAVINYRIRWMGIPIAWKTVIEDYSPPNRFIDVQASGPYRVWRHTHTFEAAGEQTIVRDRVEYSLPFGIFGQIAHALAVRRQLERIFDYRERALAGLWGEAG
jgi:ligand-binding SRPBCC domain-containing protein